MRKRKKGIVTRIAREGEKVGDVVVDEACERRKAVTE